MSFDLRSWLKRHPKPSKLRLSMADGNEKSVDTSGARVRWHTVEETVRSANPVAIEAIDGEGNLLRAQRLIDEEDNPIESTEDALKGHVDKAIMRSNAQSAAMLEAYGRQLNAAHRAGAEAASSSQEHLVDLVNTLTGHLSLAITNLHTVSVNTSNMMQAHAQQVARLIEAAGGDGQEGSSGQALAGLLQLAFGGGMAPGGGGAGGAGRAPSAQQPNGKKG